MNEAEFSERACEKDLKPKEILEEKVGKGLFCRVSSYTSYLNSHCNQKQHDIDRD